MVILFNDHYVKRKICGIGRYAGQINLLFLSLDASIVNNSPPIFFYRKGKLIKYIRFLAINFFESIYPIVYLLFNKNCIHISPSYAVPYSFYNKKTIVVVHDLAFLEYPESYGILEKFYFKINLFFTKYSECQIVVPSLYVKNRLISLYKIKQNRVIVISPYAEIKPSKESTDFNYLRKKYFIPSFNNTNDFTGHYCLLLSNAHPRKNIENTVKAYMESKFFKKNIPLLVVGSFECSVEFDSSLIIPISNVSDEDLSILYENSTCVLLFSYSEGFGFPVVEAAQFNIPCLTSNITSLAEFTNKNSFTDEILTKKEILLELDEFVDSSEYRKKLLNGCSEIRGKYTKERFESQWRDLIESI